MKKFYLFIFTLFLFTSIAAGQISKTIHCESAGTLRSLLTDDEYNTVTSLTVTGQINKTDFDLFRSMPYRSLVDLDLSTVNVVEFTDSYDDVYAANTIYENAFASSKIVTVILPKSVTHIEESAFKRIPNLQSVTLPTSLLVIGKRAFWQCQSLSEVIMNENLQKIETEAFDGCASLVSITIPQATQTIETKAFTNCMRLTSIEVAAANHYFKSVDGVLLNKSGTILYSYPTGREGAYTFPAELEEIKDYAFVECDDLTGSLNFPVSLKKIGNSSFAGCNKVTGTISLPEGLVEIGEKAFQSAPISGELTIPESLTKMGIGAFSYCKSLTSINFLAALDAIPDYAFRDCSRVKGELQIPEGVKVIGKNAFYGTGVNPIILPNSLSQIDEWAFSGNGLLKNISLPANVRLGERAFGSCYNMEKLIFRGYGSFFSGAFKFCPKIMQIDINSDTPPGGATDAFDGVDKDNCLVSVPTGKLETYKSSYVWKQFSNIIETDNGIDPILEKSYPIQNQKYVSIKSDYIFYFNENVSPKKDASIVDNATSNVVGTIAASDVIISGTNLKFPANGLLENSKSYSILLPQGFVEDAFGHPWPKTDSHSISFTTSPVLSSLSYDFLTDKKENPEWTTIETHDYYGEFRLRGYWDFEIKGIPMRWNKNEFVTTADQKPILEPYCPISCTSGNGDDNLIVDLSQLNDTIISVISQVYENNCEISTSLYSEGSLLSKEIVTGSSGDLLTRGEYSYVNQFSPNIYLKKIDSIIYTSLEGHILKFDLDLIEVPDPVKKTQTITFAELADKTYGDPTFDLVASASSGEAVSFELISGPAVLKGKTVGLPGVGVVTIKATQAGNDEYLPAEPVIRSFTVNKAAQTITFAEITNKTYGDSTFELVASASSGETVSFELISGPASLKASTVGITGAGDVSIKASQAGNENYLAAEAVIRNFTIKKAAQTITFAEITNKTYGDSTFELVASASSGEKVSFELISGPASLKENTVGITGAGDVSLKAIQAGNENYLAAEAVVRNFTIKKAAQTITFEEMKDKAYGDAPFELQATASSGKEIHFELISGPASLSEGKLTITGAGEIRIKANLIGNENYDAAVSITRNLIVTKASQSITFAEIKDKTYGDAPFNLQATASSGEKVHFELISGPTTLSANKLSITGAGNLVVKASQAGNDNYREAEAVTRKITINKADQVIDFESISDYTLGEEPIKLKATSSAGLIVEFEILHGDGEIKDNLLTPQIIGDFSIRAYQTGNDNYNPAEEIRYFTVDQVLGIEDDFQQEIKLYPNPAKDFVNLNLPANETYQVKLLNLNGQMIQSMEAYGNTRLNVRNLKVGMYFITIQTDQSIVSKRFLKVNN